MRAAAILTVSTSKAAGAGEDESGPRLAALAERLDAVVAALAVVPDERELIEAHLREWSDVEHYALVLTSGGTGLAPSDVTPEATRAVIEREAPGIAHAMREASRAHTPYWMLSRALAGTRGTTLIVNFPGSPVAIDETADALAAPLAHALELLSGGRSGH